MATPTQTRRILVKVDTTDSKGMRELADKFGLLNKNTKSLAGNMSFLTNAFRGWLGFLGVREITRMSDEMQNLSNRLKIVTKDGTDVTSVLAGLEQVADRTNQSIDGVGQIYTRLATSLQGAKATTGELMTLTEGLINTFRIAGATTTETVNTLIQLSQAFASGEVRGQELRSVMEQNATLAQLLRERFGSDIYKKAADGAIRAADILEILYSNQKQVADAAKELAPTFEQTLTKSLNKVSLAIGKLNEQFQLSAKFATVMAFAVDNLGNILIVAGGALALWTVTYIPALIKGIGALRVAFMAFAASNPITLALTAALVVGGLLIANWKKVRASFLEFAASIEEGSLKLRSAVGVPEHILDRSRRSIESLRKEAKTLRDAIAKDEAASAGPDFTKDTDAQFQSLINKVKALDSSKAKTTKLKEELAALNAEFLRTGNIEKYQQQIISFDMYKLNRQFREGKFDVFEFNKRLAELKTDGLKRELNAGSISMQQFKERTAGLNLENLKTQFDAGKISVAEFHQEVVKLDGTFAPGSAFYAGVNAYIESVGSLSSNVAKAIEGTFSALEDSFVEFTKNGKFNFEQFANAVIEDINRIIIRSMIIRPLAQGILSFGAPDAAGGTTSYSSDYLASAKGNAFDGGKLQKFAKGGIVNSPTMFKYGGGKTGLMGEAGTEAILPLTRGSDGNLGVQSSGGVVVNVINQAGSGAEVSTQESTSGDGGRVIDVIIHAKVKEGLARGVYDKEMQQAYGAKRRGM